MKKKIQYSLLNTIGKSPEERNAWDYQINFLIDTNYIAEIDNGKSDPECRKQLTEFLSSKGIKWTKIKDLWGDLCSFPKPVNFNLDNALVARMKSDSMFRWVESVYNFDFQHGTCLKLNEAFTLNKDTFVDRDFFDYFFAFRLSKRDLSRVKDFLAFCFQAHFNNDIQSYTYFITHVVLQKHGELIGKDRVDILNEALGAHAETDSQKKSPLQSKTEIKELNCLFINPTEFKEYVDVLNRVEPPIINDNNKFILGPKAKGALVAWIDVLNKRGKIHSNWNDAEVAYALKTYFQMDKFDGRTIRAEKTEKYKEYYAEFLQLIK